MSAPDLRDFMRLFPEFEAASWDGWRAILERLTPAVREFFAVVGRGAGKSRIVALIACAFASREYLRAPGESVYVGIFAPDKKQATVTFRYILGLLHNVPALAALIVTERRESVDLANGVIIEVLSATISAPRGRSYALAIVEEGAFLPQDQSANPDVELLRSLRPGLGRVPGSLLAVVSSPYARRGVLWAAWKRYHGKPDGDVVFVQGATLDLNPAFDRREVERAYEEDPAAAGAEYGGLFRTDVDEFLSPEAIAACIIPGRHELPYVGSVWGASNYVAFTDPAGGSGTDSFTLAIGHAEMREGQTVVVVDCLREARPPFSPETVTEEFAETLARYRVLTVVGDRYAGEWPREQFSKHRISYLTADRPKSDLYRDALPALNSGRLELLDHARLLAQLGGLERRTARGGHDSIDHGPGGHDDLANVVCGVVVEAQWAAPGGFAVIQATTDDSSPQIPRSLEAAEIIVARRRAARAARDDRDALRPTGSQEWLDRVHDDRSPFGRCSRVVRSVSAEDDDGTATMDGDPYKISGWDPYT